LRVTLSSPFAISLEFTYVLATPLA
jgi:hypothetical protein